MQQAVRATFEMRSTILGFWFRPILPQQCPATNRHEPATSAPWKGTQTRSLASLLLGKEQCTQPRDPVAGDKSRRDQFPQRVLDFGWQAFQGPRNIGKKRRPATLQVMEYFFRDR